MDHDGEISPFAPPTSEEPWRWHEATESSTMSATPRRLETVAESEWFHILAQIISSTLLFILIFGMSATVDVRHLRQQVHNKFAILTGVATQFIIMPVLGYVSVILLSKHGLTEPMAISLLIVTASPGGSYSNWWISMFNGDLALSVTMTAISTLISTIMLPANLLLYVNAAFGLRPGEDEGASVLDNIDWPSLFVSLAIVIGAIGMGMFASVKISSHRFNRFANRMGSLSGVLLIVFSAVVSTLSGSNESQIWGQPWSFYVGVTAPCLVGLFIATVLATLAGLRKPEVISVGVECCYQNVGIATSAAVAMFDDPIDRGQALCVPLFYGLMEGIVLGIYCIVGWKMGWTKAPRDEKFCVMVVTTYEVESDDSERSEFIGGQIQMDEERQQGHASADINNDSVASPDTWRSEDSIEHESSWSRPWSLFFSKRKRKASEEVQPPTELPRRRSLADSLNESLESISQLDAITDLVAFPDQKENIQYSRCRINSEDSVGAATAITSPISETASAGSPSSLANSSSTGSPTAKSLAKKF